jgi:2,4-dienoyl-CoA reductase-like NADH-dependent reductase (Old Yellow Enzyme family)
MNAYGGDIGACSTFALDVIRTIRKKVRKGYPVFFCLNALKNVEGDDIIHCNECMSCFAGIGCGSPLACAVNKELTTK